MPPKRNHAVSGGSASTDPGVLLKRRQDRQRANEKLATFIEERGIKRCDLENDLPFSTIPSVLLVNQKNYYTEYLKKDDNLRMIRNVRDKINKKAAAINNKKIDQLKNDNSNSPLNSRATSTVASDDDNNEEEAENDGVEKEKTLVIHPGSCNIKIGWADDVDPLVVPNIIGYPKMERAPKESHGGVRSDVKGLDPPRSLDSAGETDEEKYYVLEDDATFKTRMKPLQQSFKERMKYYKRRILPTCHEACSNFNHRQQISTPMIEDISEEINLGSSKHQDMFIKPDKLKKEKVRDFVVGDECFRLANQDDWVLRSPFLFSTLSGEDGRGIEVGFNEQDPNYHSKEEILSDIENILQTSLAEKFETSKSSFKNINVVLIIPSLYRKNYVESMIELLLKRLNFNNVNIIQEGMASSYGLGLSVGCIVDIGSSNIHIACVDDGSILEDSTLTLNYGMNDLIRFWGKNLVDQQFPLTKIDFKKLKDWRIIENLFKEHCTFDDSKLSVQVGNFSRYINNSKIRRYQFKVFDQTIMSPMSIFYPDNHGNDACEPEDDGILIGKLSRNKRLHKGLFEENKFEGYDNQEPVSILQELEIEGLSIIDLEMDKLLELLIELGEIVTSSNFTNGRRDDSNQIAKDFIAKLKANEDFKDLFKKKKSVNGLFTDAMRHNMTPLDQAIIESITIAGLGDDKRMEKLYSNICVVGGGANLDKFDTILMDRLHMLRNEMFGSSKLPDAITAAKEWKKEAGDKLINPDSESKDDSASQEQHKLNKEQLQTLTDLVVDSQPIEMVITGRGEMDPTGLAWKGGCVFGRLKIREEMGISAEDWDVFGSRCITYSSLFPY